MPSSTRPASSFYYFDDIAVDCDKFAVFKNEERRPLSPRAFDVLRYLIAHRNRVVEKSELFEQVWAEKFVTDNALTRTIADIRHALGDRAESPRYVYTAPKRGYRFIATLTSPDCRALPATKIADTGAVNVPPTEEWQGTVVPITQLGTREPTLTRRRGLAAVVSVLFVSILIAIIAHLLAVKRTSQEANTIVPLAHASGNSNLSPSPLEVISRTSVLPNEVKSVDRVTVENTDTQPLARTPTDNIEAYQLYLKGRDNLDRMSRKDIDKSYDYFQSAIRLDPNYALAHVGMAEYYFVLGNRSGNRPRDFMPLPKAAAQRALELDETLAEAHATMASILELYERDWRGAEKEMRRARELNADSDYVRQTYIDHLALHGHYEESLKESRKALAHSPLNARLNLDIGMMLFGLRRYDDAIQWFQKMIGSNIYVPGSYGWLAQAYDGKGLYEKAVEADLQFKTLSGSGLATINALKKAYASGGWRAYLRTVVEQRKSIARGTYCEPFVFAAIYARLGEIDEALHWLEISLDEHSIFASRIVYDPRFDTLRSEPRFNALVRQVTPGRTSVLIRMRTSR